MGETKKNFLYNLAYQILILIIPFITLPYISRILGTEGIGIYSYTYSIAYYFMIGAMLGLNKYGNRAIAKVRDNKKELSKTFKEIYGMQIIVSILMIIFYYVYLLLFNNNYLTIAVVQSLYVLSCLFDINWFFFGIEEFKLTVKRNTIIKILALIMVFLFVKQKKDVWIYCIILSGTTLLSQMALWPFLKRYVNFKEKITWNEIKSHFKPNLKMFLPVIAVAIYGMMDKTMLGILSGVSEVGIYENAQKIYNIPLLIITALGTVMLPKMSNLLANKREEEIKKLVEKSMEFVCFLAFPMMIGLMIVSKDFTISFYGEEFYSSGNVLKILCMAIPIFAWGDVIRTQYLIPKERDNSYIISAYLGAIANLIINLIFIPLYGAIGACIGTIIAETIVTFYQSYVVKKELPLKKYLTNILPYLLKSLVMGIIILLLGQFITKEVLKIIFQVVVGGFVYGVLNYKFIIPMIYKFLKESRV